MTTCNRRFFWMLTPIGSAILVVAVSLLAGCKTQFNKTTLTFPAKNSLTNSEYSEVFSNAAIAGLNRQIENLAGDLDGVRNNIHDLATNVSNQAVAAQSLSKKIGTATNLVNEVLTQQAALQEALSNALTQIDSSEKAVLDRISETAKKSQANFESKLAKSKRDLADELSSAMQSPNTNLLTEIQKKQSALNSQLQTELYYRIGRLEQVLNGASNQLALNIASLKDQIDDAVRDRLNASQAAILKRVDRVGKDSDDALEKLASDIEDRVDRKLKQAGNGLSTRLEAQLRAIQQTPSSANKQSDAKPQDKISNLEDKVNDVYAKQIAAYEILRLEQLNKTIDDLKQHPAPDRAQAFDTAFARYTEDIIKKRDELEKAAKGKLEQDKKELRPPMGEQVRTIALVTILAGAIGGVLKMFIAGAPAVGPVIPIRQPFAPIFEDFESFVEWLEFGFGKLREFLQKCRAKWVLENLSVGVLVAGMMPGALALVPHFEMAKVAENPFLTLAFFSICLIGATIGLPIVELIFKKIRDLTEESTHKKSDDERQSNTSPLTTNYLTVHLNNDVAPPSGAKEII